MRIDLRKYSQILLIYVVISGYRSVSEVETNANDPLSLTCLFYGRTAINLNFSIPRKRQDFRPGPDFFDRISLSYG